MCGTRSDSVHRQVLSVRQIEILIQHSLLLERFLCRQEKCLACQNAYSLIPRNVDPVLVDPNCQNTVHPGSACVPVTGPVPQGQQYATAGIS